MAKIFIEMDSFGSTKEVTQVEDGTALTLNKQVLILVEDTVPKADIMIALERARDRLNELLP